MRRFLFKYYKSNKAQDDEMFGKWCMNTVEAKHIPAQDFGWKSKRKESGKHWCIEENSIIKDFKK
jgi:hypothetical protein